MDLYSCKKYRRYTHNKYDSYISGFQPDDPPENRGEAAYFFPFTDGSRSPRASASLRIKFSM